MATIKDLALLFPHTSHDYANKQGNVSIRHDTFFSYSEAIAVKTGEKTAKVTNRKFSVTTSRHTNAVRKSLTDAGFVVVEGWL